MTRRLGLVLVALVVGLGGGGGAGAKTAAPALGLLQEGASTRLVRIDPELRVVPGRSLDVGLNTYAWSRSRDGSRLALAGDRGGAFVPELLVVDTATLRALGRVRLAPRGWVVAAGWGPGRTVHAVVTVEDTTVVTVDAKRRAVVASERLAEQVLHVGFAGDSLVLLLADANRVASARLAVVRPSGAIDVAVLRGVRAGTEKTGRTNGAEFRRVEPALAVDPARARAYVVPAAGDVAEVDLASLSVRYHALSQSSAARGPLAQAKSTEGPVRHARWLGGGLVGVAGGDYAVEGEHQVTFTPGGVRIVDTRSWTVRELAPGADEFYPAGNLLLASSATWSPELRRPALIGLDAYSLDGSRRFHLYDGTRAWVVYADGDRAYVDPAGPGPIDVVDLGSGRVEEQRPTVPWPLLGRAAPALD